MGQFTISKLADCVGVSPDTLRYYERIGLLPSPDRSPAGYRLYDDDAVARMQFIKGAQRLGLSLEEIGELLGIRERGLCPCGHTRRLLTGKLAQLDSELKALTRLQEEIRRMLDEGTVGEIDGCGPAPVHISLLRGKEVTDECCGDQLGSRF